jgi:galactitol-specific phosphotransferase system IIB component
MASVRAQELMKKLGISEAEAMELIAYDKAVDQGKSTPYDLTEEQKKVEKAMKNSDIHAKSEQKVSKVKENPKKEAIIAAFADFLADFGAETVEITNKTREITFKIGEDDYKIALTATRKKK